MRLRISSPESRLLRWSDKEEEKKNAHHARGLGINTRQNTFCELNTVEKKTNWFSNNVLIAMSNGGVFFNSNETRKTYGSKVSGR